MCCTKFFHTRYQNQWKNYELISNEKGSEYLFVHYPRPFGDGLGMSALNLQLQGTCDTSDSVKLPNCQTFCYPFIKWCDPIACSEWWQSKCSSGCSNLSSNLYIYWCNRHQYFLSFIIGAFESDPQSQLSISLQLRWLYGHMPRSIWFSDALL